MAYSRAAGSALSSWTVRCSSSEAVTTNFVVGRLEIVALEDLDREIGSRRAAARRRAGGSRPSWSSTVSRKVRSSPAEPPTSGMPSSAQAMAETTVSSALASPSISESAKQRPEAGSAPAPSRLRRRARTLAAVRSTSRWSMASSSVETMRKPAFGKAMTTRPRSSPPAGEIPPDMVQPAMPAPAESARRARGSGSRRRSRPRRTPRSGRRRRGPMARADLGDGPVGASRAPSTPS